jgi:hypothetical protein
MYSWATICIWARVPRGILRAYLIFNLLDENVLQNPQFFLSNPQSFSRAIYFRICSTADLEIFSEMIFYKNLVFLIA